MVFYLPIYFTQSAQLDSQTHCHIISYEAINLTKVQKTNWQAQRVANKSTTGQEASGCKHSFAKIFFWLLRAGNTKQGKDYSVFVLFLLCFPKQPQLGIIRIGYADLFYIYIYI